MINLKTTLEALVAILLMLSLANTVKASRPPNFPQSPQNLTEEDTIFVNNALQFLNNVANVNTSSYHVDARIANEAPGVISGKTLKLNLSSATSMLGVSALFAGSEFFWCTIYSVRGSPALNHPVSSSVLVHAKETLNKLQAFSARNYLPIFQSMLNSVTELQNSKTTNAYYTQEITVSGNTVRISWEPFANGLSNPQNKLTLEFQNGKLVFFCNFLDKYNIGSSDVKVSEAEAIQIATEHAQTFSWVQDNEAISNVTVLDSPIIAKVSLQNRGNNTLYPIWSIMLPLDKMYPGGVTAFRVAIWADTGEVSYISPIGFYGDPEAVPSSESQTPSPTAQATLENSQAAVSDSLIIGGALTVATAIIVGYLFYKAKKIANNLPLFSYGKACLVKKP